MNSFQKGFPILIKNATQHILEDASQWNLETVLDLSKGKKVNHRIISIMKIDSFYWISSNSIVSIVFTNFLIKNLTLKRLHKN